MKVYILTDHRTLENFESQQNLSRRQLHWQEELSQFDLEIAYIRGEDNPAADALSRIKVGALPSNHIVPDVDLDEDPVDPPQIVAWKANPFTCASVLSIQADKQFLHDVCIGYENDSLIKKIVNGGSLVPGVKRQDKLWYVSDRLYIPNYGSLREDLFHLAHDSCGHFGGDKSYALLAESYYWPKMKRDLYWYYIPGCEGCQRNKGKTSKNAKGPLHPLPVPDSRCESIAMDFIGPLPEDEGFLCILSITD